jgi:hypothetical protein
MGPVAYKVPEADVAPLNLLLAVNVASPYPGLSWFLQEMGKAQGLRVMYKYDIGAVIDQVVAGTLLEGANVCMLHVRGKRPFLPLQ